MFFRNWLFVRATLPVTRRAGQGPITLTSASARAVRRIVPRDQDALRLELEVEIRLGKFRESDAARDGKGPPARSPLKRSKLRTLPSKVRCERNPLRAGNVGLLKRAMLIVMSPEPLRTGLATVPLTLTSSARSPSSCVIAGKKLPEEVHRTARQLNLRGYRRLLIEFSLCDNLRNIEGKVRRDLHRLNLGLLQLAVESELIVLQLRRKSRTSPGSSFGKSEL